MSALVVLAATFVLASALAVAGVSRSPNLYPDLDAYVTACVEDFDRIPEQRRQSLEQLAQHVRSQADAGRPAGLTFICTHNSRRSHLSQIWAAAGALYYAIPDVRAYSGGTEATAFNPRAVAALKRAGFRIEQTTGDGNPIYHVRFSDHTPPLTCFSKVFDGAPNPSEGFCAVMTCTSADEACPVVLGASERIAIPYVDPKISDDTPEEADTYDERCEQIAREMLYVMSRVGS